MKYWIDKESKRNRVVAVDDKIIYFSNPALDKLDAYEAELAKDVVPSSLTGVPFRYVQTIKKEEGSKKILMQYGEKNKEEFSFSDKLMSNDFFEYLSGKEPNKPKLIQRRLGFFEGAKNHLIRLAIVGGFFGYASIIAWEIEKGGVFEATGIVGGLVLGMAEVLGFKPTAGIGLGLTIPLLYLFIRRVFNLPQVDVLYYYDKLGKDITASPS